jgi:hypothetical protein
MARMVSILSVQIKGSKLILRQVGAVAAPANDANPGTGVVCYIRNGYGTTQSITGFQGGEQGRVLLLQPTRNHSSVTIENQNAGSAAANRCVGIGSLDFVNLGYMGKYVYDSTDSRWKRVGT